MTTPSGHSPLGASGASRWMNCPGSVPLSEGIPNESSVYAQEGTIAHALAALCLQTGEDAWMYIGSPLSLFEGHDITGEMADAVQVYLNSVRDHHEDMNQGNTWIERSFHCPNIHEMFYGTADLVHWDADHRELHVWDYKHGAGVVVGPQENVQCMYYGCGALDDLDLWKEAENVVLHIAQPRAFVAGGPISTWTISASALSQWLDNELLPAMDIALVSRETKTGPWCKFCRVLSHHCPAVAADFDELETMMTEINKLGGAEKLTNDQLARYLSLVASAKAAASAAEKTAYARLKAGNTVPGYKLVQGRSNRAWKEGADEALIAKFGDHAYEKVMVSPTKAEKLIDGNEFAAQWAFKPESKLTLAPDSDKRTAVNVDTKSLFTPIATKE